MEKTDYGWWDIIKIPFRYAPSYSALIAAEKILSGLVPTLQVIVTAKFLDTAIAVVSGNMNYSEIFLPLISVVLLIVYSWVSEELVKLINVKLEMRLREKFRVTITEKRAKLKYKHVENKDTWDLISTDSFIHKSHRIVSRIGCLCLVGSINYIRNFIFFIYGIFEKRKGHV